MKRPVVALAVVVALLAGACAPKVAPPLPAGVLRYPDFAFPAPPARLGDASTRAALEDAWSRMQAADLKGAEAGFGRLLTRQPGFYPAAVGLGYVLVAQGRPKEALARFDAAIAQAPRFGPALAGRAEALIAAGQRDAALDAFEAALAADATMGDLRRRIDALKLSRLQDRMAAGKRASDAGRLDEAREAYAAAIALSPGTAFLYRDLGLVELRRKNLAEAQRNLDQALALDPGDIASLVALGSVSEARGNLDDAIAMLERAYALDAVGGVEAAPRSASRARADERPSARVRRHSRPRAGHAGRRGGAHRRPAPAAARGRQDPPGDGGHRCPRALGLPVDRRGHPRRRDGRLLQSHVPAEGGRAPV